MLRPRAFRPWDEFTPGLHPPAATGRMAGMDPPTRPAWLLLTLLVACPAAAVQFQVGDAYAMGDGRLLYREQHWTYAQGGSDRRLVLYRCPDGAAFARKRVDAAPGAATPDIAFDDGRDAYSQRVVHEGDTVALRVRDGDGERVATVPARTDAVIDAGFDAYVRKHWDALANGRARVVPFLVPDRGGWLDFRVRHVGDGREGGRAVRRLRMTLAAWYGFAAPAIELAYDLDTRRLLRFEGMGYVRDRHGGHPKVRIDFPDAPRDAGAAQGAIEAALRVPLTGRCAG
jgi:hypothetical protein